MIWDDERCARLGLSALGCQADIDLAKVVIEFGASAVWEKLRSGGADSSWANRARKVDLPILISQTEQAGARFVIPGDEQWPASVEVLDHCAGVGGMSGAPMGLWFMGAGPLLHKPGVAIVGARACTSYGVMVTSEIGYGLAELGWSIISGGAFGIDAAAHKAALAAQGETVAVLAGGLSNFYPRGNAGLFEEICEKGLVISELPPAAHPTKVGFLARNRLIAALSMGTVVVEAAARSGAKNTASWASALGRVVMAVPGSVNSVVSYTPHRLIRDGEAVLVTNVTDVVELLGSLDSSNPKEVEGRGSRRKFDSLAIEQRELCEAMPSRGSCSVGELAVITGFDLGTCLAVLGELELLDLVSRTSDGRWKLAK